MPAEHTLPDDENHWPSSPSDLFGLAADASRRDLKRAYSRLIRRFKPEHFPNQFRRLREAFEELDQQLEWRESFEEHISRNNKSGEVSTDDSCETDDPQARETYETNPDAANPVNLVETGIRQPSIDVPRENDHSSGSSAADRLWQQALDGGDLVPVYSKLVETIARPPISETSFARLYWLLTICPQLDADRDPCSWLIQGIRNHGLLNRLLPILTIEVRRRRGQVPMLLSDELLEPGDSTASLLELTELRWYVARRLSRFEIIGADRERLRRRFLDLPDEWRRLLCSAVRQLVLVRSDSASTELKKVTEEFENAPSDLGANWIWDWYDVTMSLHYSWAEGTDSITAQDLRRLRYQDLYGRPATVMNPWVRETRTFLNRIYDLVASTWDGIPQQQVNDLMSLCADLTTDTEKGLMELNGLNQNARPLLVRFYELVREQHVEDALDYEITSGAERELQLFVQRDLWSLNRWEESVLRFCLKAAVMPTDVASALERCHERLPECSLELAASIRYHLPLTCLLQAYRLVWAIPTGT